VRPPFLAWGTLVNHLIGWCVAIALLTWVSVYIVPKFEQTAAEYQVGLPYPTKVLLGITSRARDGVLFVTLVPLAIGHSVGAALWHRRATRGQRLVYRLLVLLMVAAASLFVILGLFLPMIGLINSLSGGAAPKK
jgi:hypothetical protein